MDKNKPKTWLDLCFLLASSSASDSGQKKSQLSAIIIAYSPVIPDNKQALMATRHILEVVCGVPPRALEFPEGLEFDYSDLISFGFACSLKALVLSQEDLVEISREICYSLYHGDRVSAAYGLTALKSADVTNNIKNFSADAYIYLKFTESIYPLDSLTNALRFLEKT